MKKLTKKEMKNIKGGPSRRKDIDHVGLYNFTTPDLDPDDE